MTMVIMMKIHQYTATPQSNLLRIPVSRGDRQRIVKFYWHM